jgi:hypothetical protein
MVKKKPKHKKKVEIKKTKSKPDAFDRIAKEQSDYIDKLMDEI